MLVLTRKQQEKIRIGDDITITVLRTKGKAVRLGIEAPGNVPVIRGELTFDVEENDAQVESFTELKSAAPVECETARGTLHASPKNAHWSPKSDSVCSSRRLPGAEPQVSMERVSREQLAKALPGMSAGESPLRAMVKRRSLSA